MCESQAVDILSNNNTMYLEDINGRYLLSLFTEFGGRSAYLYDIGRLQRLADVSFITKEWLDCALASR